MDASCPAPVLPLSLEEVDTGLCLYRPDSGDVLMLNDTAADIWLLVDGHTTVDQIASLISTAYDADSQVVLGHVQETLADFRRRGFTWYGRADDNNT